MQQRPQLRGHRDRELIEVGGDARGRIVRPGLSAVNEDVGRLHVRDAAEDRDRGADNLGIVVLHRLTEQRHDAEYPWCARSRSAEIRRQLARGPREADACSTNQSRSWQVVAERAKISMAGDRSGSAVAARSTRHLVETRREASKLLDLSSGSAPLASMRRTAATV